MSIDAGLHLYIEANEKNWPLNILEHLIKCGWVLDDHGSFVYSPIGDVDCSNWQWSDEIPKDIRETLLPKLLSDKILGVMLTWKKSQIGGSIVIYPSGKIIFSASINRRTMHKEQTSDVSWYVSKLLPYIADIKGVYVTHWEWKEILL